MTGSKPCVDKWPVPEAECLACPALNDCQLHKPGVRERVMFIIDVEVPSLVRLLNGAYHDAEGLGTTQTTIGVATAIMQTLAEGLSPKVVRELIPILQHFIQDLETMLPELDKGIALIEKSKEHG